MTVLEQKPSLSFPRRWESTAMLFGLTMDPRLHGDDDLVCCSKKTKINRS
ncbi:MAG: hypothetical protein K0R63_1095 [Rickettsiales bacterium]|jgi:hypothetical protein|nr:hypothetical protein [Rickettsiales bacterium]